ncbi:MAG: (deoxy)nucleoside triphosphate pyrophosphohydrolase [Steroidobacteraceae bacterium]
MSVVAGAMFDAGGRVLIAQRPPGKVLAGRWEFPGGKLEPGEDPYTGLVRELHEELGVEVRSAERLIRYLHDAGGRAVELDLWTVRDWRGTPHGREGQALKWVHRRDLPNEDILEADAPMIEALVALG